MTLFKVFEYGEHVIYEGDSLHHAYNIYEERPSVRTINQYQSDVLIKERLEKVIYSDANQPRERIIFVLKEFHQTQMGAPNEYKGILENGKELYVRERGGSCRIDLNGELFARFNSDLLFGIKEVGELLRKHHILLQLEHADTSQYNPNEYGLND